MSKKKREKNDLPEDAAQPGLGIPNEADTNKRRDGNDDENEEGDDFTNEQERVLDKEEKEMDEGDDDDEDLNKLTRDVKIIEEAMEEEIEQVDKKTKPVRQVLYKVSFRSPFFFFVLLSLALLSLPSAPFFFLFLFTAA